MSLAVFDVNNVGGSAVFDVSVFADAPTAPAIHSEACQVENLATGQVYYAKAGAETRIASMSKVMTAKILLDHYPTREQLEAVNVTITSADVSAGGGSGANLQDGDVLDLWALLVNLMVPSSNVSAEAIARTIGAKIIAEGGGGTNATARFVQQMNTEAAALGMASTSFANASGFTVDNDSTPADMVKLGKAAWTYGLMRTVTRIRSYDLPVIRSGSPTTIAVANTNPIHDIVGILGLKSGALVGTWGGEGSTYNHLCWFAAGTGEIIGICTMGALSLTDSNADVATLVDALITDYPDLAPMIGDATVGVTSTGSLTASTSLAGASIIATTATGSLTTGIALAGSASSMTLAGGVLTAQIRLQGSALAGAIAAAGLTSAIQLAAQAQAGASATGDLTVGNTIDLAGNAQAAALAAGSITTIIRFEAAAIANVLGAGTLTAPGAPSQLAADATVLAIAEGGLTTGIALRGAAASVVQASGTLDLALTFEAAAFASVLASGVLSTQVRMDSAAVASVLAAARLSTTQDAYRSARLMDVAGSRQMRVPRGRTMQFARLP